MCKQKWMLKSGLDHVQHWLKAVSSILKRIINHVLLSTHHSACVIKHFLSTTPQASTCNRENISHSACQQVQLKIKKITFFLLVIVHFARDLVQSWPLHPWQCLLSLTLIPVLGILATHSCRQTDIQYYPLLLFLPAE